MQVDIYVRSLGGNGELFHVDVQDVEGNVVHESEVAVPEDEAMLAAMTFVKQYPGAQIVFEGNVVTN